MTTVSDIMIWRDGGTVTFTIEGGPLAGKYRLRTPFAGEPRVLFRDETPLTVGGPDEAALLAGLREWFSATETTNARDGLARLDGLHEWRNLPEELDRVVPLHRVRTVIACLEARAA
jgi:hypothetical protein